MQMGLNAEFKRVWEIFEEMSGIPRCSGNEKYVSEWLMAFGQKLGFETIQETCGNVIIKKPATLGYEQLPAVILQGHMDMVCVKKDGSHHDFSKDPLNLKVVGDMLTANETSLGADNGIAVAMSLAILEDKSLQHPALEVLITVAEETGMEGAVALIPTHLSGSTLINLDSEEEGVILASCAGGVRAKISLPIAWENADEEDQAYELRIEGLLGGHSGIEIDKGRANAIVLMGRILRDLLGMGVQISLIEGGEKMNAIAKWASATIRHAPSWSKDVEKTVRAWEKRFKAEYVQVEPGLIVILQPIEEDGKHALVFSQETSDCAAGILRMVPNGVQTMSTGIPGLVESSNNIGVMKTEPNHLILDCAVRSSVKSLKAEIVDRLLTVCTLTDAELSLKADYPEWSYEPNSKIRDKMTDIYASLYGEKMKISAIHAGLECGILREKLGNLDFVSIGPNLYDVHTPEEKLDIPSTERVYKFLTEVLRQYK